MSHKNMSLRATPPHSVENISIKRSKSVCACVNAVDSNGQGVKYQIPLQDTFQVLAHFGNDAFEEISSSILAVFFNRQPLDHHWISIAFDFGIISKYLTVWSYPKFGHHLDLNGMFDENFCHLVEIQGHWTYVRYHPEAGWTYASWWTTGIYEAESISSNKIAY